MTAFDPALCARLITKARAALNSGMPGGIGLYGREVADFADQLEAAMAEVERLRDALNYAISENFAFNLRVATEINEARSDRDSALAENAKLREVAIAAGVIRNMRFAVDSRLNPQERIPFDRLSEVWDEWKFPETKP